MKLLAPVLALVTLTSFALADEVEPVPEGKTLAIARLLISVLGAPTDAPLSTDVDAEKAVAIQAGQAGLLAMPDKKLTAEALSASTKDPVVLGQLWMHKVVPAVDKAAPAPEKLRTLTVHGDNEDADAEVYYLGVAKGESGALELSLFGKDKTPLVKVPLVKTDAAASATPIALNGRKDDDHTGTLVITVFGSYKADVTVTRPRE